MEKPILLMKLDALADKSRFTMLQTMIKGSIATCCDRIEAFENGCCVADVVQLTGLSQPTVSHHLKVLEETSLIRKELRSPWTCYFPNLDGLTDLLDALNQELLPTTKRLKERT